MTREERRHFELGALTAIVRAVLPYVGPSERREIRERLKILRGNETVFVVIAEVASPEVARAAWHALAAWAGMRRAPQSIAGALSVVATLDPRAALFASAALAELALRLTNSWVSPWTDALAVARGRAIYRASLRVAKRHAYLARNTSSPALTLGSYRATTAVLRCADWAKERAFTCESAGRRARKVVACACLALGPEQTHELADATQHALNEWAATRQSLERLYVSLSDFETPAPVRIAEIPDEVR